MYTLTPCNNHRHFTPCTVIACKSIKAYMYMYVASASSSTPLVQRTQLHMIHTHIHAYTLCTCTQSNLLTALFGSSIILSQQTSTKKFTSATPDRILPLERLALASIGWSSTPASTHSPSRPHHDVTLSQYIEILNNFIMTKLCNWMGHAQKKEVDTKTRHSK